MSWTALHRRLAFLDKVIEMFSNEKSIDFDGATEYVDFGSISSSSDLSLTSGEFTLSCWILPDPTQLSTFPRIISKASGGGAVGGYELFIDQALTNIYFYVDQQSGGVQTTFESINIPTNKWTHIAATYDNTTLKLYINGYEASSTSLADVTTNTANLFFGRAAWSSVRDYAGKLDSVVYFNSALSLSEIKELNTQRDPTKHSTKSSNIISWYEFEDADISGTTLTDKYGSNNGTLVNSPTTSDNSIPYPRPYQLEGTEDSPVINSIGKYSNTVPFHGYGGYCWNFDGLNDYITAPDNLAYTFGNGTTDSPFSVSFWLKPQSFTPAAAYATKSNEWVVFTNASGRLFFRIFSNGSSTDFLTIRNNSDLSNYVGRWVHLTFTYDGTGTNAGMSMYANGEDFFDANQNSGTYVAMSNQTTTLDIGGSPSAYQNCKMCDFFIFNRELSQSEVRNMFNGHSPRYEPENSLFTDCVAHFTPYNSSTGSGNVIDLSSTGNNATMTNMQLDDILLDYPITTFPFRDGNEAVSFLAGGLDYFNVPDTNDLSFGDGSTDSAFSISAWIFNDNSSLRMPIVSKDSEYTLEYTSNGYLQLTLFDDSSSAQIGRTYTTQIDADNWFHVLAMYDGSGTSAGISLYINGEQVDDSDNNSGTYTAMENSTDPIYIGRAGSSYGRGYYNHIAFFDKVLDYADITELYNSGSPEDLSEHRSTSNLISWWRLDNTVDGSFVSADEIGTNDAQGVSIGSVNIQTEKERQPTN